VTSGEFNACAFWGRGHIAQLGRGSFKHSFGGECWKATGPLDQLGTPTLLVCLDLQDPQLDPAVFPEKMDQLPLFSYINVDGMIGPQKYSIRAAAKVAVFEVDEGQLQLLPEESRLPSPLPEMDLILRPMEDREIPRDEASYWEAIDTFLGGDSFLRIGGPPVWPQEPHTPTCRCGASCLYIASIGYERYDDPKGYTVESRPFFIGEVAHFFFWCSKCQCISVLTESV
jgi:hypothetical protein